MGGSSPGLGSSGSSSSSSSSSNSGSLSSEGITWDASKCKGDPSLIEELLTSANRQCNDLCASCTNFVEHLGLELFDGRLQDNGLPLERLASVLEALQHKETTQERDFCARRRNGDAFGHRVVLGKWENSEHEPFRPSAIKTFESVLDELHDAGGGSLIIVAQSHAGAKLAATVNDKWRWGDKIKVELFVAWDATHLGGAIRSVGSRPRRVVNFFQTANLAPYQNGGPIAESNVEQDLTGCFSHNALARSRLVHSVTYDEIRAALARILTGARE